MKLIEVKKRKSTGYFKNDQYTTEYGTIIFDKSREGDTSKCLFRYVWEREKIGFTVWDFKTEKSRYDPKRRDFQSGMIHFYIDEKTGLFKSIWLIGLKGFLITEDNSIKFESDGEFCEPVFDVEEWEHRGKKNEIFSMIEEKEEVKIIHNGKDILQLVFGEMSKKVCLNEHLILYFNDDDHLAAIVIYDEKEVPKVIQEL